MSARRAARRGYTVIEVMISIALLTVASAGIMALQKVTTIANYRAKNLAVADQVARTWVERLRTDATAWTLPSPSVPGSLTNIGQTAWLTQVTANGGQWFQPAFVAGRGSPAFDALGNDLAPGGLTNATFCTNLRLTWMYPNTVVRAEVAVFWPREGGPGVAGGAGQAFCASGAVLNAAGTSAVSRYHSVYMTTTVPQNTLR